MKFYKMQVTVTDTVSKSNMQENLIKMKRMICLALVSFLILCQAPLTGAADYSFSDVKPGTWYSDSVTYCYENGIMNGTSHSTFEPHAAMTRAMLVTVLYRMEGSPVITEGYPFTDVESGTWYSDAVSWSYGNGVVNGNTDTTFSPMSHITREQLVTMVYRYSQLKGLDTQIKVPLSNFDDADSVSRWAKDAFQWALGTGLIVGNADATLDPKGGANRAQVAVFLTRFVNWSESAVNLPDHTHEYCEEVLSEPTCTREGAISYVCSCGRSYEYTLRQVDHTWSSWTVTKNPSDDSCGEETRKCSVCSVAETRTIYDVFDDVEENGYAATTVWVYSEPSVDNSCIIGQIEMGAAIERTGVGRVKWSRIRYNGADAYCYSGYVTAEKPTFVSGYPKTYSDATASITINKEWFGEGAGAWCYVAHIQFTDYSRFGTSCANGSYNNGYETTSHAAKRLGAIFAVNGCYSAPYLNYPVARDGVVCNNKNCWVPAVYSSHTGLFLSAWETGGTPGIAGKNLSELVSSGKVTDTFSFGPPILVDGVAKTSSDTSRAQRTLMGTSGDPGDLWIIVSDGRYNDGDSAGLTYTQCGQILVSKGCTFGIPLDGGGSSTMYFDGSVLNAARGNERAVVDFAYIK